MRVKAEGCQVSGGQIRRKARALRVRPILSKYSGTLQIHCCCPLSTQAGAAHLMLHALEHALPAKDHTLAKACQELHKGFVNSLVTV